MIGATVTQNEVIGSELLASKVPILRETALQIADPQVRYLGTIGGNVANGDPGNDMPAVMMALNATYQLTGKGGDAERAGALVLPGRLRDRAAAGRDPDGDPHPGSGQARLRLREAEAEDRRLRHRRRRRRADRWRAAR